MCNVKHKQDFWDGEYFFKGPKKSLCWNNCLYTVVLEFPFMVVRGILISAEK